MSDTETKEYKFAKALARSKVELLVYDDELTCLLERKGRKPIMIVRVKCCIDGVEYGWEEPITHVDNVSVGMAIDTALRRLPIMDKENG